VFLPAKTAVIVFVMFMFIMFIFFFAHAQLTLLNGVFSFLSVSPDFLLQFSAKNILKVILITEKGSYSSTVYTRLCVTV